MPQQLHREAGASELSRRGPTRADFATRPAPRVESRDPRKPRRRRSPRSGGVYPSRRPLTSVVARPPRLDRSRRMPEPASPGPRASAAQRSGTRACPDLPWQLRSRPWTRPPSVDGDRAPRGASLRLLRPARRLLPHAGALQLGDHGRHGDPARLRARAARRDRRRPRPRARSRRGPFPSARSAGSPMPRAASCSAWA